MEYIKEAIKFYLKKYLNIVKNIFSLDMPLDENDNRLKVYDISDEDIKEFLIKSFNATDFNLTTSNRILYDRTGDIPSTELPNYSPFSFHYIVRDYDVISFKIPKEEGSYLAYYKEDLVSESLLEFN